MEPPQGVLKALVLGQPVRDHQRRVEEQLPVVQGVAAVRREVDRLARRHPVAAPGRQIGPDEIEARVGELGLARQEALDAPDVERAGEEAGQRMVEAVELEIHGVARRDRGDQTGEDVDRFLVVGLHGVRSRPCPHEAGTNEKRAVLVGVEPTVEGAQRQPQAVDRRAAIEHRRDTPPIEDRHVVRVGDLEQARSRVEQGKGHDEARHAGQRIAL